MYLQREISKFLELLIAIKSKSKGAAIKAKASLRCVYYGNYIFLIGLFLSTRESRSPDFRNALSYISAIVIQI